ncbi:GPI-anchored small secreted protein [Laccaria bicolor S238N-H82]|uniref:GPI-anchored small secreted protein n=1 Tax=Laccaria bicolor (strain S238N-H82 / ATCC MYA-4686) TaxID=486041 RepID=B0DPK4_LACBS|nr:GPI-anchored small secreted protein [Laccaria bicolor S238N-H82]EDR03468.1 GPI-anchored small secreted protein [Laccaria bicolor S238N-H82]|eukprot:XP_001885924.1 GPI-anchored small secreted protein [Laccaria bicolor S238N-H82]
MKFAPLALLAALPSLVSAIVPPGASTPLFYLVSSSSTSSANLLPVHLDGTLSPSSSSSPPAQFYFSQGSLYALSSPTSSPPYRVLLSLSPISTGCTTYGGLGFVQGSSSNKCASYSGFQIQSNTQNSQLGAQLVVNFQGGFYECSGSTVVYKVNPGDGPSGCTPVSLYTVPVV